MNKWIIRIVALLMAGCIVLGLVSMVFAQESDTDETVSEETTSEETISTEPVYEEVSIDSLEDFLAFARDCRLDSFSQNKIFYLNADIDLTGTQFESIPIFCGSFVGNGHSISGLQLTAAGSAQGLFRYLTETAKVQDLSVSGSVAPGGSANQVGGIAGVNYGRIENCTFSGEVTGTNQVGGIAGLNEIGAFIENCSVSGSLSGSHIAGGIAGENKGTIRTCENTAAINTTQQQNRVDISDITLDTITGSETTITVTDIGGIAGASSGDIANCVNRGDVGYPYMGYNVGGIAGSQSGYLSGCVNYGCINGRKEVGGIVGQLEPYTTISFATDILQILKEQVADLSALTKQATAGAKENLDNVSALIAQLEQHVANMEDAVEQLQDLAEDPRIESVEDAKTMAETAASLIETIYNSLTGIEETTGALYTALKGTIADLEADMNAVSEQVAVIESTLNNASDHLGGTVTDVSDDDTEQTTHSKVSDCANYGKVLADLNAGGIVGAIAVESDLDPENDVEILGENTLNYDVNVRAVIRNCSNSATVQVRKQRVGGIVGWMSMGLVRECINTGMVEASGADYAGGIAGSSQGYIRQCNANCSVSGDAYVGGIAGEAAVLSGCRSMVLLEDGSEKLGNIAGYVEDLQKTENNYYSVVYVDHGGIDGISYAGRAQSLERDAFLELEDLPRVFSTVTLLFIFDDGSEQRLTVPVGSTVSADQIPEIPAQSGCKGSWDGLNMEDLVQMDFDAVYTVVYTQWVTVIGSEEEVSGQSLLLAQGQFHSDEHLGLLEIAVQDALAAHQFALPADCAVTALRYLLPEGVDGEKIIVMIRDRLSGDWRQVDYTVSGSYVVAQASESDDAVCIMAAPVNYTLYILIAAAAVVLIVAVVVIIAVKKRKGKK